MKELTMSSGNSVPSKQIIVWTIKSNEATSSFRVKSWWQLNTLKSVMSPWAWCSSWSVLHQQCLSTYRWNTTQSFLPQICIAVPHKTPQLRCIYNHTRLAQGWTLTWINFTGNWSNCIAYGCSFARLRWNRSNLWKVGNKGRPICCGSFHVKLRQKWLSK